MSGDTEIPMSLISWARQRIISWYTKSGRSFSWRRTDDPYKVLIAEMLLRRTTATAVSRVYDDLVSHFPSVEVLARAKIELIGDMIKTLGLQNTRAKHLHDAAVMILNEFEGVVPDTAEHLVQLPGLGAYGVAAVLNFAFHRPVPMVDGNVVHLLQRFFGLSFTGSNDTSALEFMRRFGGRKQSPFLYWGIIDLVALLCHRRGPLCDQCPLRSKCKYLQSVQSP
ncbi:MAG: hypothetical protein K9W43_07485 [Candidatus Thorarchaeota archaeon]|nr:hypothetical protein [Candidatus Thorarchaeota archaeon]